MKSIYLYSRYWFSILGWTATTGFALIIFSAVFFFSLTSPAIQKLKNTKFHMAEMRNDLKNHNVNWVPESSRAAKLTFYQSLPRRADIPDLMERIFKIAFENNLLIENGDFKYIKNQDAAFSRYIIILPTQGKYAELRKFMSRVLQEIPSLSLDNISFNREDVKNPEVAAELYLTLYLRED